MLNLAVRLLLLVTASGYEPAENPVGRCAVTLPLENDNRVSFVVAKTTVGASPVGLKLVPVIAISLMDVFTTAL